MKVTIIIPIYNQIKYLQQSINSAIRQTYSDIQIILIDDGSTDGSSQICDKYEAIDQRIQVIHKKNGGLSSARNVGLDTMIGTYVTFLDGDDILASDFIDKAVELCEKNSADIAILDMKYFTDEIDNEKNQMEEEIEHIYEPERAIEESLYQVLYSCCAPGKIYKSEIFKEIRFPLKKLAEDLAICHKVINNANKIVYLNKIGYYYRQHNMSITHVFNPNRMDALVWAHDIQHFCKQNYPNIIEAAQCRLFNVAVHLLLDISAKDELDKVYKPIIWKDIKKTRFVVIRNKKIRLREKFAAVLTFGGTTLLRSVWNSKLAVKRSKF
ncbi:glycosyltransferase family 2 protein [Eubacteriaceae bacterium ES2]|nr:glycosyltransferase family 2 protein [Eubacteriaceae bacterium ES2]